MNFWNILVFFVKIIITLFVLSVETRINLILVRNILTRGYTYTLESQQVLTNYVINDSAKMEVEHLYDIFNK